MFYYPIYPQYHSVDFFLEGNPVIGVQQANFEFSQKNIYIVALNFHVENQAPRPQYAVPHAKREGKTTIACLTFFCISESSSHA